MKTFQMKNTMMKFKMMMQMKIIKIKMAEMKQTMIEMKTIFQMTIIMMKMMLGEEDCEDDDQEEVGDEDDVGNER